MGTASDDGSIGIDGVHLRRFDTHSDHRGTFSEVFRSSWQVGTEPVQWNVVSSGGDVLRGVHVHVRHSDYLAVVAGRATIGLKDLRAGSPTHNATALVPMSSGTFGGLTIPPGVAHGFWFHEPSIHIYAVSHYWDPEDELGCHWADPDLAIPWPQGAVTLSARDEAAQPLSDLLAELEPFQALWREA